MLLKVARVILNKNPWDDICKTLQAYKIKYWQNYFTFTNEFHSKNLSFAENLNLYIPKPNVELFLKTFANFSKTFQ